VRPLAALWNKPPVFIELFFSLVRMLEMEPVRRTMLRALAKPEH
jgi:hypothetical protein